MVDLQISLNTQQTAELLQNLSAPHCTILCVQALVRFHNRQTHLFGYFFFLISIVFFRVT